MDNQIINGQNLTVVGAFMAGITTTVIIPIIRTFFEEWRANAPTRQLLREERKQKRLDKKKARQTKII